MLLSKRDPDHMHAKRKQELSTKHYLDDVATLARMSRRIAALGGLPDDSSGDSSSSAAEPAESSASSTPTPPSSDWTGGTRDSDECFEPAALDDPLAAETSLRSPSDRTPSSFSSSSTAGRGPDTPCSHGPTGP
ncbi:hypothetical protein PR003_g13911 [Phytophthora rubi]|uniref:Uncharacterized protein n=1 Tax=Phytophthora rubi TaxID=129364 RepID=A0A6A4F751_9STRA|nr:hypothetical protein PR003_g13911 [Phytophthora rubi]